MQEIIKIKMLSFIIEDIPIIYWALCIFKFFLNVSELFKLSQTISNIPILIKACLRIAKYWLTFSWGNFIMNFFLLDYNIKLLKEFFNSSFLLKQFLWSWTQFLILFNLKQFLSLFLFNLEIWIFIFFAFLLEIYLFLLCCFQVFLLVMLFSKFDLDNGKGQV